MYSISRIFTFQIQHCWIKTFLYTKRKNAEKLSFIRQQRDKIFETFAPPIFSCWIFFSRLDFLKIPRNRKLRHYFYFLQNLNLRHLQLCHFSVKPPADAKEKAVAWPQFANSALKIYTYYFYLLQMKPKYNPMELTQSDFPIKT